ncbi:hypothetical protein [Janthinobacterium fluminis]|uniref:Uncharacterized protein n=1 Tax=Janthinobacterium fluminis TaxID=2987524 RepID=A0ABT5K057_9BURK|nr:hypothetical protein [Janthinobacterium fluminis]MDC8757840.1 hypothetical protein [Janthinobacterium fluminis]
MCANNTDEHKTIKFEISGSEIFSIASAYVRHDFGHMGFFYPAKLELVLRLYGKDFVIRNGFVAGRGRLTRANKASRTVFWRDQGAHQSIRVLRPDQVSAKNKRAAVEALQGP